MISLKNKTKNTSTTYYNKTQEHMGHLDEGLQSLTRDQSTDISPKVWEIIHAGKYEVLS